MLRASMTTVTQLMCFNSDERRIQTEWQKFAKFGLGLALDILPISTCSTEEAPDLYIGLEEESGAPEFDVPPNDLCRRKMTEIVVDLVDAGLL